jgi:hypothetical protein
MDKEFKKNVFLGEKRDPSKRYANANLRNQTHITQKPSYVYLLIDFSDGSVRNRTSTQSLNFVNLYLTNSPV